MCSTKFAFPIKNVAPVNTFIQMKLLEIMGRGGGGKCIAGEAKPTTNKSWMGHWGSWAV